MDRRYERQAMIPQIGAQGQERLASANAAIVGAGGLGSPALYYLAAAGVGTIKIIDSDAVEISNLNRQIIHFEEDVGLDKASSAMRKLQRFNKSIHVLAHAWHLDGSNAEELLAGCDIVLACVDNNRARRTLNKTCIGRGIPLIIGGVQGFEGYIMAVVPGVTPCYQCIFPESRGNKREEGSPGIIGAAAGVLGSMMAMEAIKTIIGVPAEPFFYYVDLLSAQITPVKAARSPLCEVCGRT